MKVIVNQSILNSALSKVQSAVSNKASLAVLNNILVEAKDGNLTLTATDLDQTISSVIPVNVKEEGTTTIPAKKLTSIVRQLSNADIELETKEDITVIRCLKSKFKIQGIGSEVYPSEEGDSDFAKMTINSSILKNMLNKISYAICTDETRRTLNGVLFSIADGNFTTVATDGRRLALMECIVNENLNAEIIVPSKAVNELLKLLAFDGEIGVMLGGSEIQFIVGDTTLKTKILDGNFPNYKQVIPTDFEKELLIPRDKLSTALQRVSVILTEASSSIRIKTDGSDLVVNANTNNDESTEVLDMETENEAIEMSFNPTFISDPLKKLECDSVVIKYNDSVKPIVMAGDQGFLYVIMPMRG